MWACLFFVVVLRTAVLASPPRPISVSFTSVNFQNILLWSPGNDTPADTTYSVRYAIYGDSKDNRVHWRVVQRCSEITRTRCDLSEETSDLEHGYYAKVRAVSRKGNSKWVMTQRRFDPKIDTEFGPPHVSVEVEDKYISITIEGPMKYLPNNKTPQVSMATLYPHMTYILSVNDTRSRQIRHFPLTSNQFKYHTTDHGAELCFSVRTKLNDMPSKHHSSAWHCTITPEVPLIDRLERIVIISTTVPAVLLCVLVAGSYVLYKYLLGTDQKSPGILRTPTFFPPPLPVASENVNIIVIPVYKDVPINDDDALNKLYPKLPNLNLEAPPLVVDLPSNDVGGLRNVKNQGYKEKDWQIAAKSSGSSSPNSFLESLSSSVNPVLLNQSTENGQGLTLRENPETGSAHDNEMEIVVSSGYASQNARPAQPSNQLHDLPDEYGFVSSPGYASQNAHSMQPINQSDLLPDNYGLVGLAPAQEAEEPGCLQIDWSPSTHRLVIPGLDLGTEQGDEGSPPRNRVHLDTVFVRQPSEEEALLGAERGGSGQWDTEEFMAKWDLVLSND